MSESAPTTNREREIERVVEEALRAAWDRAGYGEMPKLRFEVRMAFETLMKEIDVTAEERGAAREREKWCDLEVKYVLRGVERDGRIATIEAENGRLRAAVEAADAMRAAIEFEQIDSEDGQWWLNDFDTVDIYDTLRKALGDGT